MFICEKTEMCYTLLLDKSKLVNLIKKTDYNK